MKTGLYYYILLMIAASVVRTRSDEPERKSRNENLEDFPLDENDPASEFLRQNNVTSDYSDRENYEEPSMESKQKLIFQRLIAEAMKKPGAYQTFAQVLPILRMMSAPQRLALAGMVMKQLTGESREPYLESNDRNNTMSAELMLPISMDVAKMFHGDTGSSSLGRSTGGYDTFYPNRNAPTNVYRPTGTTIYPARRPPILSNRRTVLDIPPEMRPPPPPPGLMNPALRPPSPALPPTKLRPTLQIISPHRNNGPDFYIEDECKLVASNLCSEVIDYPESEILESIESVSNKGGAFNVLLESSRNSTEYYDDENQRSSVLERRVSAADEQGPQICSSAINRVRPRRGKAANGQWKYIVNTGEYTQTLRLEMCQKSMTNIHRNHKFAFNDREYTTLDPQDPRICIKPKEPCSLIAENYASECTQTFNYHRLVTWDKTAGLTMDIFRVPTCCSCHVTGFATFVKPPTHKKFPIQEEFNENNFVIDDDSAPVQQRLPPPRLIPRKTAAHSTPKRESSFIRRPNFPIQQEAEESKRIENSVRRTQSAPPKQKPAPDSRQGIQQGPIAPPISAPPAPPAPTPPPRSGIEDLLAEVAIHASSSANKPASKRINYSYHPIIDFFKSSPPIEPKSQSQRRVDMTGVIDDWTPIDGPRSL